MIRPLASLASLAFVAALGACQATQPPVQPQYPPGQYPPGYYPPQPQGQGPQQPLPPPPVVVQRPLLAPLIGAAAWQAELRSVLNEEINALSVDRQNAVRGIPLVFDPTYEVNAYAGCDDAGAPFLAATAGVLEAIDGIAQTKATDELFGTQTYTAYCNAVLPAMAQSDKARAALPAGIIPTQYGSDARRWSRAHELFDEILAFTFGHELGHHYLGHTGCAKGQGGSGPDPTALGRLALRVPAFNQVAEAAADNVGALNALDTGRARRPNYEWSEAGGLALLDYFARLESAAGVGGLGGLFSPNAFLKTHPNPLVRIPLVRAAANTWHLQHPAGR